jgi:hypothetical protein
MWLPELLGSSLSYTSICNRNAIHVIVQQYSQLNISGAIGMAVHPHHHLLMKIRSLQNTLT